jgi:hypothetical protein
MQHRRAYFARDWFTCILDIREKEYCFEFVRDESREKNIVKPCNSECLPAEAATKAGLYGNISDVSTHSCNNYLSISER